MLVRVKETQVESFYGYYARTRLYPGDEFELVARKCANGKTISAKSQFSDRWMEEVVKEPEPKVDLKVDPKLDPPLI